MAPDALPIDDRARIARAGEHDALLSALEAQAGLTVVACAPLSGTSALLAITAARASHPCVRVDARACTDPLDLAMEIADRAVEALAPEATSWWTGRDAPSSTAGLRLWRRLGRTGIDPDPLRNGQPSARIEEALRLADALDDRPLTVIIDHLGPLLYQLGHARARLLLAETRAAMQRLPGLGLMLVDQLDGAAAAALDDEEHPLFRAGALIEIRRPHPREFAQDLADRGDLRLTPGLVASCADLVNGVPALTWLLVDLADADAYPPSAAFEAWRTLKETTDVSTAREWETLRRVHPLAQTIAATLAGGLRPHAAIAANDKSVTDALRAMRGLGIAWQPRPRTWALANPLQAAYARGHPPPWLVRGGRQYGAD